MKKLFKTLAFALVGVLALASCEDVPAPYTTPSNNSSTTEEEIAASGTGTATDPFNVKGIQNWIEGSEFDANKEVYIKGIITSFKEAPGNSYGNATFYIADTPSGSNTFYVYRCYGLNGNKFTDASNMSVGDTIVVKSTVTNYNGTLETVQNKGSIVTINGKASYPGNDTPDTPAEAVEVSVTKAAELCNALEDGATSSETYSITGYITDVYSTISKGQQSFWMADTKDGGKVLQAYWANLPEGVDAFVKGSKVKITGQLLKYVKDGAVTAEVKNATVEIIEKGEGNNDQPATGDATEVNCAKASELALALEDKATSTETYAVTGYITEIVGSVSKSQQTFWMADTKDGGKVFEAYWANLPEGVSEFTVGSKVKITGQLMRYGTTPEIKNATVVILEKAEGGSDDGGNGDNGGSASASSLENGDFEAWTSDSQPTGWKSASTASNATLGKSTDAHGGSYAVKVAGVESANKRLASQEIELEAGTYKFAFYVKATTDDVSQARPGYVPVTDGKVGNYVYGDYANLSTNWTLVEYEFTLDAKTTICLVVMNPKKSSYSSGKDILIDDATLTKK